EEIVILVRLIGGGARGGGGLHVLGVEFRILGVASCVLLKFIVLHASPDGQAVFTDSQSVAQIIAQRVEKASGAAGKSLEQAGDSSILRTRATAGAESFRGSYA